MSNDSTSNFLVADEQEEEYVPIEFTTTQMKTMTYTYYITPTISLIGSCTLLYAIIKGQAIWKKSLKPSFVRLLGGFALMDVVQSIGSLAFGPWSVPADTTYVWNASGSIATCNVNGFFNNFLIGFCLYSACLALYHLFTVRYQWKESTMERIEPVFHGFTWIWNCTSGILLIAFGFMNPMPSNPGYCWAADLPASCTWDYEGLGLECERGEGYWTYSLLLATSMVVLSFLVIVVSFLLIYLKVRDTEKRIARYTSSRMGDRSSASEMEITRKTGRRAMRYIGAFLLCNVPILIAQAGPEYHEEIASTFYFNLTWITNLILPLQGAFNACIFFQSNRSFFEEGGPLHGRPTSFLCCVPFHGGDNHRHCNAGEKHSSYTSGTFSTSSNKGNHPPTDDDKNDKTSIKGPDGGLVLHSIPFAQEVEQRECVELSNMSQSDFEIESPSG